MAFFDSTKARPAAEGRAENESLAERLGIRALSLRVSHVTAITPSCRRIQVEGDELENLNPLPGQDLMISLGAENARTRRRRYTIRHFDPAEGHVDLDIALHGDGPGVRWATTAELGDPLEAVGPRGKIGLDPGADWHLFIGDDSFAPAALNMAEAVPAHATVLLAIEIDGPGHEQPAAIDAAVVGPRWVYRDGAAPGDPAPLLGALAELPLLDGSGHAYVGGEYAMVGALGKALGEWGLGAELISAKPYWRLGRQNAANGEPERD